jgi:hypothetical protein
MQFYKRMPRLGNLTSLPSDGKLFNVALPSATGSFRSLPSTYTKPTPGQQAFTEQSPVALCTSGIGHGGQEPLDTQIEDCEQEQQKHKKGNDFSKVKLPKFSTGFYVICTGNQIDVKNVSQS